MFPDLLTHTYSLKPPRNQPKIYTNFTALPRRWFLYGLACVPLFRWTRNPSGRVTGPVRITSLIFTLFYFSFLCPFDLKIKSQFQKWAKSSFPSCCAWDVAISSNLLASWFIHEHWWLSDFPRHCWGDVRIVSFPCKKYSYRMPQSYPIFFATY